LLKKFFVGAGFGREISVRPSVRQKLTRRFGGSAGRRFGGSAVRRFGWSHRRSL